MTDDASHIPEFTEDDFKDDPRRNDFGASLIAQDLVTVRPMDAPRGDVMWLDYVGAPQPVKRSWLYQFIHWFIPKKKITILPHQRDIIDEFTLRTVEYVAAELHVLPVDIIEKLHAHGINLTPLQLLDYDTAEFIRGEYSHDR